MHELEQQKIQLEIEDLRRHFLLRPNFVVPVLIGLLSFSVATYNGWFDLQSQRLTDRRERLNWEIQKFQNDKATIEQQINELEAKNGQLRKQVALANAAIASSETSLRRISAELRAEIERGKATEQERDRLAQELESVEASLSEAEAKAVVIRDAVTVATQAGGLGDDAKYDTNGDGEIDENEWKQKAYDTLDVDDDGCFLLELDDGAVEQHCLNY